MTTSPSISRDDAVRQLWLRGELTWKLHAGQLHINSKLNELPKSSRQIALLCGRRWGKSFYSLFLAMQACLRKPGARILLLAPYANQASEITGPLMAKLTADAPEGLIKRIKTSNKWNFSNGSMLMISGMDLIAETKRGLEFDHIFLEESGSSNPEMYLYTVNHVLFPMLLASRGRIFHVTTLPKEEDHPFITDIMPRCDDEGALFSFPTTECPLYTKEQLDEMCNEIGGPNSIAWRREFLNQQVRDSSLVVIPEYTEDIVKEFELPSHYNYLVAGDLGGSIDRSHFLFIAYDFKRARTLIIDECTFPNTTSSLEIAEAVKVMEARHNIKPIRILDCPGQERLNLMGPPYNFPCSAPANATDEREVNINLIRTSIPTIEIHPRCKTLINTLKYQRWNSRRSDFVRTDAYGHADAIMALAYGLKHLNKNNPFPAYQGDPIKLHIPHRADHPNASAQVLKSLFIFK